MGDHASATRRTALGGLISVAAAGMLPAAVRAQARVPLVGLYTSMGQQSQAVQEEAFLQGMRDLGYIDGRNVQYAFVYGEGVVARYGEIARELAAQGPDVVVSSQAITGAEQRAVFANAGIPVVVAAIPPNSGLIQNLDRPEGNMTGILNAVVGDRERLALAIELVPGASRIGYLLSTGQPDGGERYRADAEAEAASLPIALVYGSSVGNDDAAAAFQGLVDAGVDAVIFPALGSQFNARRADIIELARASRMPTVYDRRDAVWEGGLIGFGPDQRTGWRHAAAFVDRILRGAVPADLAVERSTATLLAINLLAAADIGLSFPASIVTRANEVVN